MNSGCAAALDGLQDFCFMAAKAANREPCPPPLPTLDFAPAFEVYTELGIDPYGTKVDSKLLFRLRFRIIISDKQFPSGLYRVRSATTKT